MRMLLTPCCMALALTAGCTVNTTQEPDSSLPAKTGQVVEDSRRWLAGDHHIHSRFSVGWDITQTPPAPQLGGDAIYMIPMNALMARHHGLSWTVATDHGGPNHSKVSLEWAYPELTRSREVVGDVVQFFGMELNTPGADHSSVIIPHTHDEAQVLHELEKAYDKREAFPHDVTRDTEDRMIEALKVMDALPRKPVVIANHPSRSAKGYGEYGLYEPAEFRRWNDTAPDVAVGMAGAPGHQAISLNPFITDDKAKFRGGYRVYPTMGGFDQMTAKLGGFWDSMLGEGRRWWVTANSDSHRHYTEGGIDFWPGEYSKTYVFAEKNHESILGGIRDGRVFVTLGDLISELYVEVSAGGVSASIGGSLEVSANEEVVVSIKVRDPETLNAAEQNPRVNRVDLISGMVRGPVADTGANANDSAAVLIRFDDKQWQKAGEYLSMSYTMVINEPQYVRVRGTNTEELEPEIDPPAEMPWSDLWFYSNPVFIDVKPAVKAKSN
jgi:hypothetical protein